MELINLFKKANLAHPKMHEKRGRVPLYLRSRGIPCIVWGEDVCGYYMVPTVVFSLNILVHDVEEAARVLSESGLRRVEMNTEDRLNPHLDEDGSLPRFEGPQESDYWPTADFWQPDPKPEGIDGSYRIQLLPAKFWRYILPSVPTSPSPLQDFVTEVSLYPPLVSFMDSLIDGYLDAPNDYYALEIRVWIGYLCRYNSEVKKPDFGKYLREEHQPFWTIRNEKILKAVDREDQRAERDKIRNKIAQTDLTYS